MRAGAVAQGTSYGAPCELENVLARIVIDRVPSIEMVRFVNSGTEACLSVLRLMRAYTKRDKVCRCGADSCALPSCTVHTACAVDRRHCTWYVYFLLPALFSCLV